MTKRRVRSHSSTASAPTARPPRWRRLTLLAAVAVAVVVGLRPATANLAMLRARQRLAEGDLGDARRWAEVAGRWGGSPSRRRLLLAAIARRRGQWGDWKQNLQAAREAGDTQGAEREEHLGRVAGGRVELLGQLDVPESEALEAVLYGSVATDQMELAEDVLSNWLAGDPQDPHALYWQGVLAERRGDVDQATSHYRAALQVAPRHQRAQLALARLLEQEEDFEAAYLAFAAVLERDEVEEARVAVARLLRLLGRLESAEDALRSLNSEPARLERGRIAFERGQYQQAIEHLRAAGPGADDELLATALHLAHRDDEAERLLEQIARDKQRRNAEAEGESLQP